MQAHHAFYTLQACGKALPVAQLRFIVSGKAKLHAGHQLEVSSWQQKLIQPAERHSRSFHFDYSNVPSLAKGTEALVEMVAVQLEHLNAFKQEQENVMTNKLQCLADQLTAAAKLRLAEVGCGGICCRCACCDSCLEHKLWRRAESEAAHGRVSSQQFLAC